MLIAYDAGHGKNTAGKRSPSGKVTEREWYFNDEVARSFAKELSNYNVKLLRTDDPTGNRDVSLKERTDKANKANADVYISFHHNAYQSRWGNHTGVETYYYKGNKPGQALASKVQKALVSAYGLRDRGIKTNNLHITRETRMVAVLVEGGFMDSNIDIKKLRNKTVLQNAGKAIAQVFVSHYGLKRKSTPKPPTTSGNSTNKGNTFYRVVAGSYKDRKNAEAQVKKLEKLGIKGVFLTTFEK